jgi:hypothetical protein
VENKAAGFQSRRETERERARERERVLNQSTVQRGFNVIGIEVVTQAIIGETHTKEGKKYKQNKNTQERHGAQTQNFIADECYDEDVWMYVCMSVCAVCVCSVFRFLL